MFNTNILRLTTGLINTVNDEYCGGGAGMGPARDVAGGQQGAGFWLDDQNLFYDSSVGTVYGGHFRYVKLAADADAVVVGQIVFNTISDQYTVTTDETEGTENAMFRAGIVLNPDWEAGKWSVIQDIGQVYVKFRGTLTAAGAIGSPVFCAGAGAGVDQGLADVIASGNPVTFSDSGLMAARWIGTALQAPTNGGLKLVNVNMMNTRL